MDIDDERAIFEDKVLLPPAKEIHKIIQGLGGRDSLQKLGKDTLVLVPNRSLLKVDSYYKKGIIYNRRLAYKKRDGTLRSLRQLGLLFGHVCRYIYERDENVNSVETVVKNKETGLDEIVKVPIPYTDDLKEKIAEHLKIKCGYVARHYIVRNENGVEREIAVIKPNSLSFKKASQKQVNDFFTNLNNFLVAAYGHSLEEIKKRIRRASDTAEVCFATRKVKRLPTAPCGALATTMRSLLWGFGERNSIRSFEKPPNRVASCGS